MVKTPGVPTVSNVECFLFFRQWKTKRTPMTRRMTNPPPPAAAGTRKLVDEEDLVVTFVVRLVDFVGEV